MTGIRKPLTLSRMVRRLREMAWKLVSGVIAVAGAVYRFIRQTHAARLVIMALRLWRPAPLPSSLVACVFALCLYFGWTSGWSVREVLLPVSPAGIGAAIAGIVAGLAVLELTAALAITLMVAALQLAYDTGRHRILALLALASAVALASLAWRLVDVTPAALAGFALPASITGALVTLTIWFERAYLRPAYPGFRDFWADIVDARHFLNRAAHGE